MCLRNVYFPILMVISLFRPSLGQDFPEKFSQQKLASNINSPTCMTFADDGTIFIGEHKGQVRIYKDGVLKMKPVLDLNAAAKNDKGLIGMTLDPDFESNGFIYVVYTPAHGLHNVVSRFDIGDCLHAHEESSNSRISHTCEESEVVLYELDTLKGNWHVGGAIKFGTDGKLYFTTGDNSHPDKSQNMNSTHGKIFRINKDGTIPEDNPFDVTEKSKAFWGIGLRNPYTIDIDDESGKIYINDVGGSKWEEINDATVGGQNFGWPIAEGTENSSELLTDPIYAYAHGSSDTTGNSITGGAFLNSSQTNYPEEYHGKYFFMEFSIGGWINCFVPEEPIQNEIFVTDMDGAGVYLTQGPDGNLYYLSRIDKSLYRIIYSDNIEPLITQHPEGANVIEGEKYSFQVSASGENPLSYQWYKDDNNINKSVAKTNTYTIFKGNMTLDKTGDYYVVVSNDHGIDTSNTVSLEVFPENSKPVPEITIPTKDSLYVAGDTIHFKGNATDDIDGEMDAASLTWLVDFHHDDHIHDAPPIAENTYSGEFIIPNIGEIDYNVFYRLILQATDSDGFTSETYVDYKPVLTHLTFKTNPSGLGVEIDGPLIGTPYDEDFVQNLKLPVSVPRNIEKEGIRYEFGSWSNGQAISHIIRVPENDTEYIASYKNCSEEGPTIPKDLKAEDIHATSVSLSWSNSLCESLYIVKRKLANEKLDSIGNTDQEVTKITLDNLKPNTEYTFVVQAKSEIGISDTSNSITLKTNSIYTPTNLNAEVISNSRVKLSWGHINDDNSVKYIIQRSETKEFSEFEEFESSDTTFIDDTGLEYNRDYYYRVQAYKENEYSGYSESISVKIIRITPLESKEGDENNIVIYPNPSRNSFTLNVESKMRVKSFNVINQNGVLIDASFKKVSESKFLFDVSGYSSGIYNLVIQTNSGNYIQRVIVK